MKMRAQPSKMPDWMHGGIGRVALLAFVLAAGHGMAAAPPSCKCLSACATLKDYGHFCTLQDSDAEKGGACEGVWHYKLHRYVLPLAANDAACQNPVPATTVAGANRGVAFNNVMTKVLCTKPRAPPGFVAVPGQKLTATFRCHHHFWQPGPKKPQHHPLGEATFTCMSNSDNPGQEWDHVVPQLSPCVRCPNPTIPHGSVSTMADGNLQVTCDAGFTLNGAEDILNTCSPSTGAWLGVPTCMPCAKLLPSHDDTITVTSVTPTTAAVACRRGLCGVAMTATCDARLGWRQNGSELAMLALPSCTTPAFTVDNSWAKVSWQHSEGATLLHDGGGHYEAVCWAHASIQPSSVPVDIDARTCKAASIGCPPCHFTQVCILKSPLISVFATAFLGAVVMVAGALIVRAGLLPRADNVGLANVDIRQRGGCNPAPGPDGVPSPPITNGGSGEPSLAPETPSSRGNELVQATKETVPETQAAAGTCHGSSDTST